VQLNDRTDKISAISALIDLDNWIKDCTVEGSGKWC